MRLRLFVALVVLSSGCLAAFAPFASAGPKFANLTGAQEVPGPGDPDGTAAALINLKPGAAQVCVAQRHNNIDAPIAMHIHSGATGVAGPIVVDLTSTLSGTACVTSTVPVVRDINNNPANYYLNIHTGSFSAGAVRGQLETSLVTSGMPTTSGPSHLFGRMSGAQEVPGPGDPDGTGSTFIDLKKGAGKVCVDERYAGIAPATLMHIHTGAAGIGGPILVNLTSALNGGPRCVTAPAATIGQIKSNPAGFYCNIHNGPFGAGAIRGQLEPSS